jgi:hypothetical protein
MQIMHIEPSFRERIQCPRAKAFYLKTAAYIHIYGAIPRSPLSCGFIAKHASIEWLKLIKKNLGAHLSYFSFYKVDIFSFPKVKVIFIFF